VVAVVAVLEGAFPPLFAAADVSPSGTLPLEGVFESCSLDQGMQTCLQRLQAMQQGGMQVVVVPAWGAPFDSLRTYAADAESSGMSVMGELSNPTW